MKDILKLGHQRPIEEHEIYKVKDGWKSERVTRNLTVFWSMEKVKNEPSLFRALFQLYGVSVLSWSIIFSIFETAST